MDTRRGFLGVDWDISWGVEIDHGRVMEEIAKEQFLSFKLGFGLGKSFG